VASDKAIVDAIGFLRAVYPTAQITEMTVSAYAEALHEAEDQALYDAARSIARKQAFFPRVNELIDECRLQAAAELAKSASSLMNEWWEVFCRTGRYESDQWAALTAQLRAAGLRYLPKYAKERSRRIEAILDGSERTGDNYRSGKSKDFWDE